MTLALCLTVTKAATLRWCAGLLGDSEGLGVERWWLPLAP